MCECCKARDNAMRGYGSLIIALTAFLAGAATIRAAEVPDDTAPEMNVKSRNRWTTPTSMIPATGRS